VIEPTAALPATLPEPLGRWVVELLGAPAPAERHATCAACAMCPDEPAPPSLPQIRFTPGARCCTYRPVLVNHLAGRIARDAALRPQLDARLAAGEALPFGLRMAPPYQHLYRHAAGEAFGRAEALSCPHLVADGGCGIWSQRPAICATWFCKHERGALGREFWVRLREALHAAERLLAAWCLQRLGFDAEACHALQQAFDDEGCDAAALDARPDQRRRRLWGDWWGREIELYQACAELVAPLGWAEVERIGGFDLAQRAERAREAARAHADREPPSTLNAGHFQVLGAHAGQLRLQTYSPFDPLDVAPEVLAWLARCDGRRSETIAAAHEAAGGRAPDRHTLRLLADFGVVGPRPPA
jgi:hypothetical protein